MPRAFWKGVISFGLVAIPVKMYVGTESQALSFHLLHKKCLTRLKQVLHCEKDNEYFAIKDTVRGSSITISASSWTASSNRGRCPTDFNLKTMPDRLKKTGDLWADILAAKKDLSWITGPKDLTGASKGSE